MDVQDRSLHGELRQVIQQQLERSGIPEPGAAFVLHQVDAGTRGYLLLAEDRSKHVLASLLRQVCGVRPQRGGLWVLLSNEAAMIVDAWQRPLGPSA